MRILHIADSLNPAGLGGYESYLHYLSHELHSRGHQTKIVTQAQTRKSPSHESRETYDIHFLRGNLLEARKWEFISHPKENREKMVGKYFSANDLQENVNLLSRELHKFVGEYRPHIIHCHSTYVVFNRVLGKQIFEDRISLPPIAITIHGLPKPLILPSGEKTTDYETLFHIVPYDLILGVSDAVKEALEEQARVVRSDVPIKRLYLGIDLDTFTPTSALKKWDLAFMGRFERMKAAHIFPEVLSKLERNHESFRFVMTGEGSLKDFLLEEIDRRELNHAVEYLGVIPTGEVPKILNASKIFMYPSKREPFGLSILEAMACEIPVITTRVFGPKEIITHNVDGIMVEPESVEDLVKAVDLLLENEQHREKMGKRARETVEMRFSLKKHTDSLLEVYTNLIERSNNQSLTR